MGSQTNAVWKVIIPKKKTQKLRFKLKPSKNSWIFPPPSSIHGFLLNTIQMLGFSNIFSCFWVDVSFPDSGPAGCVGFQLPWVFPGIPSHHDSHRMTLAHSSIWMALRSLSWIGGLGKHVKWKSGRSRWVSAWSNHWKHIRSSQKMFVSLK